jgi:hypothetical protein
MLIVSFMLNNVNAQRIAMIKSAEKSPDFLKEQKIAEATSVGVKSYKFNNININARRDFIVKYKDVNNASWYYTEGGFVAKFTSGETATAVTYNSNGEWLYTIKSCDEKNMPKDVRAVVKRTYYDYYIVNVEEIKVPLKDNSIFLVYVQDATSIKVLRVYDGEMEVLHDYTRG